MTVERPFSIGLNVVCGPDSYHDRMSHYAHGFRTDEAPSAIFRRVENMVLRFYDAKQFGFNPGANAGGYPGVEIDWEIERIEFSSKRTFQLWRRIVRASELRHQYI